MSIFWFVIHSITGCPDHDCVPANKGKKQLCKKTRTVVIHAEVKKWFAINAEENL